MTPQATFMVLAPITPAREGELRHLLDSMNDAPGRVNPHNALVPFAQFETLHFARMLILEDQTLEDVQVYGLAPRTYPLYLTFLGDIDGDEESFLQELVSRAGDGLRKLFACCDGFMEASDLLSWMIRHRSPAIAAFGNWRGRTVRTIHEEAALYETIEKYIATLGNALVGMPAPEVHATLRKFIEAEKVAGHLKLTPEEATPIGWLVSNALHLVGVPLLVLLVSPILILSLPFYLFLLRHLETTDAEVCPAVDQSHSEKLALAEDHDVTNQFSALGSRKPGLIRLLTLTGALLTVNYAARHITRPGHLGRIRTIHFARWVFLDGNDRMVFFSNYDGSVEAYMDDFINKTGFGLNASFGSAIGYPTTNWLLFDGCADERKYKEYIRRHTIPTQVGTKLIPA